MRPILQREIENNYNAFRNIVIMTKTRKHLLKALDEDADLISSGSLCYVKKPVFTPQRRLTPEI